MAGTSNNDFQNGAPFYLDPNQQDLLLAALASNNQNSNDLFSAGADAKQRAMNGSQFQFPADGFDPAIFTSPQQSTPAGAFSSIGIDESPYIDYIDGDNFDFDNADNSDLMIGGLPGDSPEQDGEDGVEKRKSPDDDVEDPDGGGKRREPEDKQAKKPGRKPLTSEPTTVGCDSRYSCQSQRIMVLICYRNAKPRIARLKGPSENAKRSISRTWRSKFPNSRKHPMPPIMRTAFFVAKCNACRWSFVNIESAYR